MAGPYGVTDTGFVKRTAEDINKQLSDDEIAELGPSLDTSSTSPMGAVNGAVTKLAIEVWDQLEATYIAMDPDRNTGDGQDAICAITGTTREGATHSQVAVNLSLGAAATVSQGDLMSVAGAPDTQFALVGPEPAPGDPVVPGDVISVGAGTYAARFQAVETGPVVANANTLTVIRTPRTGWTGGTNPLDADLGQNIETPSALRVRRENELAAAGSTPVDALRGELYRLLAEFNNAGFVDVVENVGDVVDADGRPPHSLECLIDDGLSPVDDDLIAQTIWDGRAGGIQTFGATTGTAIDELGKSRPMNFNRPGAVPIYLSLTVTIDADHFPADGDTLIKEALVAYGDALKPGADVIRTALFGPIFSVPGVVNVPVLHLGTAPGPTLDADISIGVRSRATFDTSRIVVAHT